MMLLLAIFYDAVSGWSAFGRAAQGLTAAVVGLLLASACRFGRATLAGPIGLGIALALLIFGRQEVMGWNFYFGTFIILTAVALYPLLKRRFEHHFNSPHQ